MLESSLIPESPTVNNIGIMLLSEMPFTAQYKVSTLKRRLLYVSIDTLSVLDKRQTITQKLRWYSL